MQKEDARRHVGWMCSSLLLGPRGGQASVLLLPLLLLLRSRAQEPPQPSSGVPCNASQILYDVMLSLGSPATSAIRASYGELYRQFEDPALAATLFFFDVRSHKEYADALLPLYQRGNDKQVESFVYNLVLHWSVPGKMCLTDLVEAGEVQTLAGLLTNTTDTIQFTLDEDGKILATSHALEDVRIYRTLQTCRGAVHVVALPLWVPAALTGFPEMPLPVNLSALVAQASAGVTSSRASLPQPYISNASCVGPAQLDMLSEPDNRPVDASFLAGWARTVWEQGTDSDHDPSQEQAAGKQATPGQEDQGGRSTVVAVAVSIAVVITAVLILLAGAARLRRRRKKRRCEEASKQGKGASHVQDPSAPMEPPPPSQVSLCPTRRAAAAGLARLEAPLHSHACHQGRHIVAGGCNAAAAAEQEFPRRHPHCRRPTPAREALVIPQGGTVCSP